MENKNVQTVEAERVVETEPKKKADAKVTAEIPAIPEVASDTSTDSVTL